MGNKGKIVDLKQYKELLAIGKKSFDKMKVLSRAIDVCLAIDFSRKPVSDARVRELRQQASRSSTSDLAQAVMNSERSNWLSQPELYLSLATELKERILEKENR